MIVYLSSNYVYASWIVVFLLMLFDLSMVLRAQGREAKECRKGIMQILKLRPPAFVQHTT